ncbi:MAG: diguanylate cyclase [Sphingomonadales bacterium]|nr:diguanylate cyclase [Sphingomonadales bacterium]
MESLENNSMAEIDEDRLEFIYDRYKNNLERRIANINRAWRRIRHATVWSDELHALISDTVDDAHKLSGSAGIFGYGAVSDIAAPLEYILHHINQEAKIPSQERIDQVEVLVVELVRSLDKEAPVHFAKALLGSIGENKEKNKDVYQIVGRGQTGEELSNLVQHFDYNVTTFDDITEVLKATDDKNPAAILLDMTEVKDPSAALRMVEELQLSIPFILFVNEDDFDTRLMVAQAGGRGFMLKPVDEDELIAWLDRVTGAIAESPYEVLIVDNDIAIAQSYAVSLIKSGMRADVLDDPRRILDVLAANKPDVILLDIFMPNFSGIDLAKVIRQQAHFLGIPIMFLTNDPDVTRRYQAMIYGADDILQKPVSPTQLVLSVVNRAARARALRSVMERDGLTGLYNHAMLKERLLQEVDRSLRIKRPVTFALLDIDFFKKVNDNYGHVAGDMVLKTLSKFLMKRLRKTDIVGRYGGEEFAIILTDSDIDTAHKVVDELREKFAKIVHHTGEHNFQVTFSCGLCEVDDEHESVGEMIEIADRYLYKAKELGRNVVVKE